MLANISPLEDLEKESLEIQSFLAVTCSDVVEEIVNRGNDLQVYIARTGKMLADAKYHLDVATMQAIKDSIKEMPNLSPSTRNDYVKSSTVYENYIANWIERLNRSCTHNSEWCRTLVSKAKAEMLNRI
jgi:hypothetical protein